MKTFFGIILIFVGIIGALYLSIWWGLVQPLVAICQMYDAHTITAIAVAHQAIHFILRDGLAAVWALIFIGLGAYTLKD